MRKFVLTISLLFSLVNLSFAQKFGYVDTDYILSKLPEYKQAQSEIQKLANSWDAEIQGMYEKVEKMEADLKAEEVLLSDDMIAERQKEIDEEWKKVKEYQKKVFGFEGLYFLKKQELIKPVQDIVFESVERVAKNNRLQIVFDKSGDLVMIYTDPIHDYTDFVLEDLGLISTNEVINNQ
ncbi:MAG TPA: OmpH family outer membrane protein [Cyclobacteriaceae bacterium]